MLIDDATCAEQPSAEDGGHRLSPFVSRSKLRRFFVTACGISAGGEHEGTAAAAAVIPIPMFHWKVQQQLADFFYLCVGDATVGAPPLTSFPDLEKDVSLWSQAVSPLHLAVIQALVQSCIHMHGVVPSSRARSILLLQARRDDARGVLEQDVQPRDGPMPSDNRTPPSAENATVGSQARTAGCPLQEEKEEEELGVLALVDLLLFASTSCEYAQYVVRCLQASAQGSRRRRLSSSDQDADPLCASLCLIPNETMIGALVQVIRRTLSTFEVHALFQHCLNALALSEHQQHQRPLFLYRPQPFLTSLFAPSESKLDPLVRYDEMLDIRYCPPSLWSLNFVACAAILSFQSEGDDEEMDNSVHCMSTCAVLAMDIMTSWNSGHSKSPVSSEDADKRKACHDLVCCCHCLRLTCLVLCNVPKAGTRSMIADRLLLLALELVRFSSSRLPAPSDQPDFFLQFLKNCIGPVHHYFNSVETSHQGDNNSSVHHLQRVEELLYLIFEVESHRRAN
jgi:hypothetical protein